MAALWAVDAELAAGNEVNDVELGRGEDRGKIAVVVNHPFRSDRSVLPEGILYREMRDRDPELFEYYTADEQFSLVTGKFKPMKLTPLGPGLPQMCKPQIGFPTHPYARSPRDFFMVNDP